MLSLRNFDKHLRKNAEVIRPGDNVFLRVERKDEKETRHKLAPIAEGPFPVLRVDGAAKTVIIKRPDESLENVSRSRVTIAPKPENDDHHNKEEPPVLIDSIIHDYPAAETTNLQHVADIPTTPADEKNLEPAVNTPNNSNGDQAPTNEEADKPPPDNLQDTTEPTDHKHKVPDDTPTPLTKNDVDGDNKDNEDETEEFVMEKVISHRTNKSKKHRHAEVGKLLYRIRWYDFGPSDDTWEPVAHIPRSKILSYHKRKGIPLPPDLDDSIDG